MQRSERRHLDPNVKFYVVHAYEKSRRRVSDPTVFASTGSTAGELIGQFEDLAGLAVVRLHWRLQLTWSSWERCMPLRMKKIRLKASPGFSRFEETW